MDEKLKELIEAVERRAEKATPGVWKLWGMQVHADRKGNSDINDSIHVATTHYVDEKLRPRTFDADFIAFMRTAAPELCTAIRKQAERIEELESAIRSFTSEEGNDLTETLFDTFDAHDKSVWLDEMNAHRKKVEDLRALVPPFRIG